MSTVTARVHPTALPGPTDGALVVRRREGDRAAWAELVGRHDDVLHTVARSCGLGAATADDVVQTAWVKLHGSIAGVEKVESVRWRLPTTVRRDAIRARHRERRWVPLAARISATDQRCLGLLFDDRSRSYREVGRAIGSVGPTRGQVLRRLAAALRAENGEVA